MINDCSMCHSKAPTGLRRRIFSTWLYNFAGDCHGFEIKKFTLQHCGSGFNPILQHIGKVSFPIVFLLNDTVLMKFNRGEIVYHINICVFVSARYEKCYIWDETLQYLYPIEIFTPLKMALLDFISNMLKHISIKKLGLI